MGLDEATPSSTGRSCWHLIQRDRKSTRLNSSHTVISTLSLHDALPILPEILVHDFRKKGYLPEALLNFLALLGWSPGGDRERMSMEEMMSLFSVDGIGRSNAKFDRAKLLAFNTERSEEHTSELQSHSDLHSFPTRRSSDLAGNSRPRFSQEGISAGGAAEFSGAFGLEPRRRSRADEHGGDDVAFFGRWDWTKQRQVRPGEVAGI